MTAKRLGLAFFLLAALWSVAGLLWIAPSSTTILTVTTGVGTALADDNPLDGDPDEYNGGGTIEGDPDEFVGGGESNRPGSSRANKGKTIYSVEVLRSLGSWLAGLGGVLL
jgi:hypothetical protein